MGGAAGIEVGEGPARAPAPRRPPPAPRPRHVERTSHACTVTQEVKETGTHGPTSHRNKDGGPCGSEGDQLGRERAGGRGEGQGSGSGTAGEWGPVGAGWGSSRGWGVEASPGSGSVAGGGRGSAPGPRVCAAAGTALRGPGARETR